MKQFLLLLLLLATESNSLHAQANKENNFGGVERTITVDGVPCRYMVLQPKTISDPQKPLPVWIGLHGVVGCSEHALWGWHEAAQECGAILLAPQGTFSDEKDGEGYNRWDRERDPRSFSLMLDALEKETPIDRSRIALLGFSDGGWLALQTLAENPDQFHFVAVIAGAFWGKVNEGGLKKAAQNGTPLFYACGQADPHVNKNFSATVERLQKLGFEVTSENPAGVEHNPQPFNSKLIQSYRNAPPLQRAKTQN